MGLLGLPHGHGLQGGGDRGSRCQRSGLVGERAGCAFSPGYFPFQALLTIGAFSKFTAEFPLSNVIREPAVL